MKKVESHNTVDLENDTYDLKERREKESLPADEVKRHWEIRAQRKGIQKVMSARHTLEENEQATKILQEDIFAFLGDLVEDKEVFEMGVGVGRMTKEIAKRAKRVVGNDLSLAMLEKAKENLVGLHNVELHLGKLTDLDLPKKSFDLVFESIVLLHILDPQELEQTVNEMKELSDKIFIVEHTYEGPNFPISKYSILRKSEEYEALFKPFSLTKEKTHVCAGDTFTMMLFENTQKTN